MNRAYFEDSWARNQLSFEEGIQIGLDLLTKESFFEHFLKCIVRPSDSRVHCIMHFMLVTVPLFTIPSSSRAENGQFAAFFSPNINFSLFLSTTQGWEPCWWVASRMTLKSEWRRDDALKPRVSSNRLSFPLFTYSSWRYSNSEQPRNVSSMWTLD